jgi:hypothetical protein
LARTLYNRRMSSGIWIGVAVGIGIVIATLLQRKKAAKIEEEIVPVLRERGALTLPELAEAVGRSGVMGRGKVAMALNQMAAAKRVEIIPAPEGTPQLEKIKHIKYRLV